MRVYHAAPLHYVPSILADGALFAKDVLAARGIAPRRSAFRRDRMLGLGEYVHFSFEAVTPLLRDKAAKGYPHAVIVFDAPRLAALPAAGLLPCNTKCWRSKAALEIVTDPVAAMGLIANRAGGRSGASVELLVKYGAGLECATEVRFAATEELAAVQRVLAASAVTTDLPMVVSAIPHAVGGRPEWAEAMRYFERCIEERAISRPPDLVFD
jgi:hypothetical protein